MWYGAEVDRLVRGAFAQRRFALCSCAHDAFLATFVCPPPLTHAFRFPVLGAPRATLLLFVQRPGFALAFPFFFLISALFSFRGGW